MNVMSVTLPPSDFGANEADLQLKVEFYPTRPAPAIPGDYFPNILGNSTGEFHDKGPYQVYSTVFVCPSCVVTKPHTEITCVTPPGFGGQLEWVITLLDQVSLPFRCGTLCSLLALCSFNCFPLFSFHMQVKPKLRWPRG